MVERVRLRRKATAITKFGNAPNAFNPVRDPRLVFYLSRIQQAFEPRFRLELLALGDEVPGKADQDVFGMRNAGTLVLTIEDIKCLYQE